MITNPILTNRHILIHSLKHQRLTTLGYNDLGTRKFEFVITAHIL